MNEAIVFYCDNNPAVLDGIRDYYLDYEHPGRKIKLADFAISNPNSFEQLIHESLKPGRENIPIYFFADFDLGEYHVKDKKVYYFHSIQEPPFGKLSSRELHRRQWISFFRKLAAHDFGTAFLNRVEGIYFYTFQKEPISFYTNLQKYLQELRQVLEPFRTSAYVLDLFDTYKLFPEFELFRNLTNHLTSDAQVDVGHEYHFRRYGQLIESIIREVVYGYSIQKFEETGFAFTDENSIEFNKYLSLLNQFGMNYWSGDSIALVGGFSLGSVSFLSKGINKYLVDVPFKDYFGPLNKYLLDHDRDELFYSDYNNKGQSYRDGQNAMHFNFLPIFNDLGELDHFELYECKQYDPKERKWVRPYEDPIVLDDWLSFLHGSIFYEIKFKKNPDTWEKVLVKRLERSPNDPRKTIKILWFYHKLEVTKTLSGLLNYAFYSYDSVIPEAIKLNKISDHVYHTVRPFIETKANDLIIPVFAEKAEAASLETQVSRILARNFAHNIGSHVLNRATLQKLEERYRQFQADGEGFFEFCKKAKTRLDEYVIRRQNFLAEPIRRFKPQMFIKDVFIPFLHNTLVMDNIAYSEEYCFDPELQYNKLAVELEIGEERVITTEDLNAIRYDSVDPLMDRYYETYHTSDVEIAIGDAHAFYSILENVIRNSAKYDKKKPQQLVITVRLKERPDGNSIAVEIWDNSSLPEDFKTLQKRSETPLVENYQPVNRNLGFQDIRVNSAMLQGKTEFSTTLNEPGILELHRRGDGGFSYNFSVLKPDKVALIGDFRTFSDQLDQGKFQGIKAWKSAKDAHTDLIKRRRSFDFVVIHWHILRNIKNQDLRQLLILLPNRILVLSDPESLNIVGENKVDVSEYFRKKFHFFSDRGFSQVKFSNGDELTYFCWKHWMNFWPHEKKSMIYLQNKIFKVAEWNAHHHAMERHGIDLQYIFSGQEQIGNPPALNDNSFTAFYSHHWEGAFTANMMQLLPHPMCDFAGKDFYQSVDKKSQDYLDFEFPDSKFLPFELMENALLNIVIADERLLEYGKKGASNAEKLTMEFKASSSFRDVGPLTNFEFCIAHNIRIISHISIMRNGILIEEKEVKKGNAYQYGFRLNISFKEDGAFESISMVDQSGNPEHTRMDLLVIHRTFLAALTQIDGNELLKELNQEVPWLFITSGGGSTHNLTPDHFKFIDFNLFQSFFDEQISKLSLTRTLMA